MGARVSDICRGSKPSPEIANSGLVGFMPVAARNGVVQCTSGMQGKKA